MRCSHVYSLHRRVAPIAHEMVLSRCGNGSLRMLRADRLIHSVSAAASLLPQMQWSGPRGNFAPAGANDAYLNAPTCGETLFTSPKGLVNLDTGAPCQWWLREAQKLIDSGVEQWKKNDRSVFSLQYGPTAGQRCFRSALATFLTRQYGESSASVAPDGLFQTTGATQGFSQCLTAFFGRTPLQQRTVFMEDTTYFLAPKVAAEHGFNIRPVPVGQQGLDVTALEESVQAAAEEGALADGLFSGVVYCIPTHHNPTGVTLPVESRKRLVEVAETHNLLVICDDVYELLSHPTASIPPRLVQYDSSEHGCVIGNGSFSKILAPGVRTGWIEARPKLVEHLAASATVSSSGANSQLMGAILAELMQSQQLDSFVEVLQLELCARMEAVQARFQQQAPPDCTLTPAEGGMCTWLEMPAHFDSHAVLLDARRAGVSFKPGDLFTSHSSFDAHRRNCCRIVVPHYDVATLLGGIDALCGVLWDHARRASSRPWPMAG